MTTPVLESMQVQLVKNKYFLLISTDSLTGGVSEQNVSLTFDQPKENGYEMSLN